MNGVSGAVTVVGNQLPTPSRALCMPACRVHPARHPLHQRPHHRYMGVDVSGAEQFRIAFSHAHGIGSIAAMTPSAIRN